MNSEHGSFAAKFEAAWARPSADGLVALLHKDVVIRQPHLPAIRGATAVKQEFDKLFAWLPGLHSVVSGSCENEHHAYIEHQLRFPVGKRMVCLSCVDHFELRDGKAVSRVVYFDQIVLIRAVLRHPSLWPGFLRYRFGGGPA